ncbi:MAG TPA: Nramp family divalent metal transporter [Candidatus Cloacimonadota bacterium]|nr:Nramp family divalent metal transporter [Candidatus Cloacimonadota bacterium]HQL14723.1 Nramp family divalent metal transporter [Candidatus Cloacimonadota bacterium]
MKKISKLLSTAGHKPAFSGLEIIKYIGPGLLVTVGFIDPGNWASNLAAGAGYGYKLLWMVTLSTIILIILQHNAAHLGIATGLCLAEAGRIYLPKGLSFCVLASAILAAAFTAMAEILGGAIALQMLFHLPLRVGSLLIFGLVMWLLLANSYRKLEKYIIGFVSLIGFSFIFELSLGDVNWSQAASGWVSPVLPANSIVIVMSVLGAVVMPHNLFLHSEVIQSRQWNLQDEKIIRHQLNYEFADTVSAMLIGWAINSAMIILAASAFYEHHLPVTELSQAQIMLKPLLGKAAAIIFAVALLMAGIASSVTAGMAGGTIFAGLYQEPYDIKDRHSKIGVGLTFVIATLIIMFIRNPFQGLIYSQMLLSLQLPVTIFLQIYLTSKRKVMGKYANSVGTQLLLWIAGAIVFALNVLLLIQLGSSL